MSAESIIFYILALLILGLGVMSIVTRKILHAALYLFFALVCVAGFYFLLNMQFLAGVQIAVYVGGVVVFIIFSVFLTSQADKPVEVPSWKTLAGALTAAVIGIGAFVFFLWKYPFSISSEPMNADVERIGALLLDYDQYGYALPFEVISVILLAALMGSILIAKTGKTEKS